MKKLSQSSLAARRLGPVRLMVLLSLASGGILLGGCGQKGPLTLPTAEAVKTPSVAAAASATTQGQR
jgi:predicted small lipoprotein YifL